jgi:hypothetical protein
MEARRKAGPPPFDQQAAELVEKLHAGLQGMVDSNQGNMEVTRQGTGLTVHAYGKVFSIGVERQGSTGGQEAEGQGQGVVTYASPKTGHAGGPLSYTLDAKTGQWTNTSDGHYLLELLSRDLIYHAKGYPTF